MDDSYVLESLLLCTACSHSVGNHTSSGCNYSRCTCPHDTKTLIDFVVSNKRLDHRTIWSAIRAYRGRA